MHVSLWNVVLQTLNFLVLVWLLQRFLFKPVRATLTERQETIDRSLREADQKKAEAERALEQYRERSAEVAGGAEEARARAVAAAEQDIQRARSEAAARAQAEAEEARAGLARERSEALRLLEARAVELAVAMADRLLRDAVPDSDAPFLWKTIAGIDALDATGRAAAARCVAGGSVEAVSSRPLDGPTRERFERWLSAFAGGPVPASYRVDGALIAGVEIRLPTGVWRSSWRDSLERVKAEMVEHGTAA